MICEDLERWKRYLTPGIVDTAPPTSHTERELLVELVTDAIDNGERVEELEAEVRDLEARLESALEDATDARDAFDGLENKDA